MSSSRDALSAIGVPFSRQRCVQIIEDELALKRGRRVGAPLEN